MRVWSIQSLEVYEKLMNDGVVNVDPDHENTWLSEEDFKQAYNWLVKEMEQRIGSKPEGVSYPWWAWAIMDGKNEKPDLRTSTFNGYVEHGPGVVLEFEIPDDELVLTDEPAWHYVLNQWLLSPNSVYRDENDEELDGEAWDKKYDEIHDYLYSLPEEEQKKVLEKSWLNIFGPNPEYNQEVTWKWVQATFWQLRKDRLISARKFKGRKQKGTDDKKV